jgi:hypothetical protein
MKHVGRRCIRARYRVNHFSWFIDLAGPLKY